MTCTASGSSITRALLEEAHRGNLDPLAARIRGLLVRFLMKKGLQKACAEDIAQDCVIDLLERFRTGEVPPGAWDAYARTTAFRRMLSQLAGERRRVSFDLDTHGSSEERSGERLLLAKESHDHLRESLLWLQDADRDLLRKHYLEETPLAELLGGGSREALYKRHERAKERLRDRMLRAQAA